MLLKGKFTKELQLTLRADIQSLIYNYAFHIQILTFYIFY